MADRNSLRALGFGFGIITAMVIAVAAFAIEAHRSAAELAPVALLATR